MLQEVVKEDTNFQKINFDTTTKLVPESQLFFFLPTHLVSEATMQRLFSPVPKSPPAHATFIVVTPGNNEDEDGGTRRHTRIYIWCPIKVLLSNHNSTPLLQVLNGARRSNTSDLLHCTETRFRSVFGRLRRFGILTMACQNKCQRWFESGISCAF